MRGAPRWFGQLTWELPWSVAALRARIVARQNPIPSRSGCYVFTGSSGALVPGRVLYVGKAIDLRRRVRVYLIDYMKTVATAHKGGAFLFDYRDRNGDDNTYVRWAIYGDPIGLEGALMDYLEPWYNDRNEEIQLADEELLDASLLP